MTALRSQPLEIHPLAALIPAMSADEYRELLQSMQIYGFKRYQPILIFEGRVLDGRHRQRAAFEAGIDPIYADYEDDNPEEYILLANVHRRHLTTAQRAEIVLEILPAYRERAKQRQRDAGGGDGRAGGDERGRNASGRSAQTVSSSTGDRARDEAAQKLGVSGRTVANLERVKREAPDLYEEVRAGEKTVDAAHREMKRRMDPPTSPAPAAPVPDEVEPRAPRPLVAKLDEIVFTAVGFADSLDGAIDLGAALRQCSPDELRTYDRRLREARSKLAKFNFAIREARNGDDRS